MPSITIASATEEPEESPKPKNKGNKISKKAQSEDDLIVEGFLLVRAGILSGSWESVCAGYQLISSEHLEPPTPKEKPKTRLEKIREGILSKVEVDDNADEVLEKGLGSVFKKEKPEPTLVEKRDDQSFAIKTTENFKGGDHFAQKGFKVIETAENLSEREKNEIDAKKTMNLPQVERITAPKDTSSSTQATRYYEKPPKPPGWGESRAD